MTLLIADNIRDVDDLAAGGSQGFSSADFICDICGKPFGKKVDLSLHRRKMHATVCHQDAKIESMSKRGGVKVNQQAWQDMKLDFCRRI